MIAEKDFILALSTNKIFSINEPGIIFIGLISQSFIPIIVFERQAILAKQFISGDLTLPSKQEMMNDLEKELKYNESIEYPRSKFYIMNANGYSVFDYNEDLCKLTKAKVDTEVIGTSCIRYAEELNRLCSQNNSFALKSVDFEKVFADLEFTLKSELF